MYIRWLGAFRGAGQSFLDSLNYEFSRVDEVACENVKGISNIPSYKSRIGLLINSKSIIKSFRGDVWSESENGRLKKTRKPNYTHTECWANPCYSGLVLRDIRNIKPKTLKTAFWFANLNNIKVFRLNQNGSLTIIRKEEILG